MLRCPGNYFEGGNARRCWGGSPRGEGLAGSQLTAAAQGSRLNPSILILPTETHLSVVCTPQCRAGSFRFSRESSKPRERGVGNRCARCCCVTLAGALVVMGLEKRMRGIICSSGPGYRQIDAVSLTGREELLAGETCPSFQTAVGAGPFAPQIAPRPLKINSRIVFFFAGGAL